MKKTQLLIGVTLMLAAACSKKDNGTTPSGTISTTISTQIAKTDTLSTFNKFFAAAALSDAELSEGVTVFAPSNSAFGNATVSGSGQLPDESVIKDYIVKGVLTEADFTKGKTLTTLSGKTLTVSVVVDPVILVNGMILNMNAVGSNDKFKVYGAAQLLNAPAPVFITVYDATKWSSSKINGEVIAGATVGLYKTQESFAAGNAPDYSALSAADGVAVVNGVKPGRYYVAAGKGTLSNIFSVYAEKDNDNYIGYAASDALDAQGNFVWKDLNQDGQVNGSDVGPQPALSITTQKSLPLEINVLTGYLYKPITTLDDARTKLNAVYSGLTALYTNLVLMDGVLSDEAACGFNATYCPFNTFTMTASTSTLNAIWNDSYFKGIHKLNDILYNIDGITGSQDEKNDVKGQALALRGYLYSNLLTYFGEIPVSNSDRGTSFYPGISRTTTDDVYKMIEDDFDDAIDLLPASRADNKAGLTKYAAYALLAKVARHAVDRSHRQRVIAAHEDRQRAGACQRKSVLAEHADPAFHLVIILRILRCRPVGNDGGAGDVTVILDGEFELFQEPRDPCGAQSGRPHQGAGLRCADLDGHAEQRNARFVDGGVGHRVVPSRSRTDVASLRLEVRDLRRGCQQPPAG